MTLITIKHRWTNATLYEREAESVRNAVETAVSSGADLSGADLSGADLSGANLSRADLSVANFSRANLSVANLSRANFSRANLSVANLSRANLSRANLSVADLSVANLSRADLSRANLSRADLSRAYLSRADLSRADLSRADLSRADLSRADLSEIKDDFLSILSVVPTEVPGLLTALNEGRIDGTSYQGNCACLVGTIANMRHCNFKAIPGLVPDSSRPAERWFLAIRKSDTPANNPVAAIVERWIVEWLNANPVTEAVRS